MNNLTTLAQQRAAARAAVVEDVEWLLGTDTPESIARRVGAPSVGALCRRLARAGRPDLAAWFEPARQQWRAA